MSSPPTRDGPILILGAGCFGLATAYSLASNGYTNVTVLEKDDRIPSRFSGGFDLNKIVRAEYADPFYTPITLEAIRKWQSDPLYAPYFFQRGFLNVVSGSAPQVTKNALAKYSASITNNSAFDGEVTRFSDGDAIKAAFPKFTGALQGWNGYINRLAGYTHSANAMQAVYRACLRAGVSFRVGSIEGEVVELVYAAGTRKVVGVRTKGNKTYRAHTTIVALGANVARLLPSISNQVTGSCWGVAHIQLTSEEAEKLKGIPVVNVRDIGFFFEPDLETNKLKICHLGGGYTNRGSAPGKISLPFKTLAESDFIPAEDERQIRRLLHETFPEFANRPLIDSHLCWFADSPDSDYIIDFVPGSDSSLVVLSGDSGHGFKMLPIIGDYVLEFLKAGNQKVKKWQWKSSQKGASAQVSWRASSTAELSLQRARL